MSYQWLLMLNLDSPGDEVDHDIVLTLNNYPLSKINILKIANTESINDEVRQIQMIYCK